MKHCIICLFLATVFITASSAQPTDKDDDYPIRIENEIVVTATRNEVELKTLGNAVTVATREDTPVASGIPFWRGCGASRRSIPRTD